MGDLKTTQQGGGGYRSDSPRQGTDDAGNGSGSGAAERSTRGKDDADATGTSINQGHGHPREERGTRGG
ncbi:MAG: hypothetical protein JWM27_440 [Gemmatimonadetes bacterium]|nr:hypothetical protein [Gemmatimonadota bacterium]